MVVDASWYLAAMQRDPRAEFLDGHIPGAVFWDIDALSEQNTLLPHMLPDPRTAGRQIGGLGISNADRVVVYDGSGNNLSAPRVWWELRVAGHDEVAVLDGGLAKWKREGRPLEDGAQHPGAATIRSAVAAEAAAVHGGSRSADAHPRGSAARRAVGRAIRR